MQDSEPNREQARFWNELGGARWVAMQRDLDTELEPFGIALASALGPVSGDCVLDVGCGAGATSLMLAEQVRPGGVVGIDISRPLLDRARERAHGMANLRFELADAQTFAFAAGSFDKIFSRFGVMFFAAPVEAFSNLRTALRSGGKLGFVCWRTLRENPAFSLPLEAGLPFLPEPPPDPDPTAPSAFAFADPERVRAILRTAGYREIEVAAQDTDLVFGGRSDLEGAVDLALQVGPLARVFPTVPEASRASVRAAVRDAFAPYHKPSGVTFRAATWIVTATGG